MFAVLSSAPSVRPAVPAAPHAAGPGADLDILLRELAYAYRLSEQVREAIEAEGVFRPTGAA